MIRNIAVLFLYISLVVGLPLQAVSQTNAELDNYFKNAAGLSAEQIAEVRGGKAIGKALKSRIPDEIFVFGVVYIKAGPENYIKFANDFDRLKKLPEFLALGKFSNPPQVGDLEGFTFDNEDIKALKECKPHDCDIQMPAEAIEDVHKSINWSAPDLNQQINRRLHERIIARMQSYRSDGNRALGVYVDKENPVDVSKQFQYMLSYVQVLPKVLPDFHHYLLAYPTGKTANIEDQFYWAKVKFGLKPTLRVIQISSIRGQSPGEPVYTIAEKQLYSSHYFETALDLTFCVRDPDDPQRGFYLIKAMGSEQSGLTGFKGSIVRKVAVSRTASSLEKSLAAIKNMLETKQ